MIAVIAAALLTTSPAPTTATPAAPTAPAAAAPRLPPQTSGAWSASDEEISRGLVAAYRQNPQRRVCATYTITGSSQPRSVCGTLQSFFNQRNEGEVRRNRAPQRLIDEIKEQRARARQQQRG